MTCRRQWVATELEMFDLTTSDVDLYEGEDGEDAVMNMPEETSHTDDRSTQYVEDWGHSAFDLGTSNGDGYEGKDGDDADADKEEEVSQADDGSTQNVQDWGHSTRECEAWTVYFRPVKYNEGKANGTASDVSETKTVL